MAWLVFLNCAFFYSSIFTFYAFASEFFQETGDKPSPTVASNYVAIPNLIAIVVSPTMGFVIDKWGRTIFWIITSSILLTLTHLMCLARAFAWDNMISRIPLAVIMVVTGFAYSIFASAIWPMLPFIIKRDMLGTAYGMMTSVQNTFLVIVPFIAGEIQSDESLKEKGRIYIVSFLLLLGILGISVAFTLVIYFIDLATTGGILNDKGEAKEKHQERLNGKNVTLTVNDEATSLLDNIDD